MMFQNRKGRMKIEEQDRFFRSAQDCEKLFEKDLFEQLHPNEIKQLKENFFLLQNMRYYKKFRSYDF